VKEVTRPTVQPDGTTYIGQYTVTLTRGTATATKALPYTQTKKSAELQGIADGIPDLAGEYVNSPYMTGALLQVRNHVNAYLDTPEGAGITAAVEEVTRPTVQPDGTTYIGQYTVTLTRGTATATKALTFTQAKKSAELQGIADGIPDLAGEYVNAPYVTGALTQVRNHVNAYLDTPEGAGITAAVEEVTRPTVQPDGTTYIGQYTVTLTRGTATATKALTYTQTKKSAELQGIADGIPDLAGEYVNAPYVSGALTQVRNHVNAYLDTTGEAGITAAVEEATRPTVQPNGTTYIGQYTVTLTRGTATATKALTFTQTKK
jgi:hypothetical protein